MWSVGLDAADWEAWRAMEAIHTSGRARLLGVSNVSLEQLDFCAQQARVRPRFVQNRCFAVRGWDRDCRSCSANQIIYQGFSLLTANGEASEDPPGADCPASWPLDHSDRISVRVDVGMLPLTGTTSAEHMRTDLDVFDFHLNKDEIECIETLVAA